MSYSEEEQVERLKQFWQENGTPILIGISVALAVFAGWRYWQQSQLQSAADAGSGYQAALEASQKLMADPADKTAIADLQRQSQQVIKDHPGSAYAVNSALLLAKRGLDAGDLKEAEKHLRWVLDESKADEGFKAIAGLRLARVLDDKGDVKGALAVLDGVKLPAFLPSREELRGDILRNSGDVAGARKAYQAAVDELVKRKEPRPNLEAKLADVGLEAPEIRRPSPVIEDAKGA